MTVLRKIKKAFHRIEEVLTGAPRGFYDNPPPASLYRRMKKPTSPGPDTKSYPAPHTARRDFSSSHNRREARRADGSSDLDITDAFRNSYPPADPVSPVFKSGGGGDFSGAGATGSFGSKGNACEPPGSGWGGGSDVGCGGGSDGGGGGGGGGEIRKLIAMCETASGRRTSRDRILELA